MYKIVRRIQDNDRIFGYVIADEKGNTQDILAKQLIQYIDEKKMSVCITTNNKTVPVTKEAIYLDLGVLFVLVAIMGGIYVVVNQKTKEQKEISKDVLIKSISSGAILVSNIYLRKTSKGVISIVCKEPEKVKRIEDTQKGMKHYKGELGDFWYDPNEFAVQNTRKTYGFYSTPLETCLHYIGKKTKGIVIPKGIKICRAMFYGCESLEEASEIPEGVTDCWCMFYGCTSLKEAPAIPKGVTNCHSMFEDCESLIKAPEIPNSVTGCMGMFSCCTSLKEASEIPKSVTGCGSMFYDCESLEEAPKIPEGIKYCKNMFAYCYSLKEAPEIPKGVENCESMFMDCTSLVKAPEIPSSVNSYRTMFKGCSEEVQKQGAYNIEHRV